MDDGAGVEEAARIQVAAGSTGRAQGLKVFQARQQEDILAVRDLVLEYHAESRYAHLPFSEPKFIRLFSKAIASPKDTLALYVRHGGKTVGLIHAGVGEYYLGDGGRIVTVYALYVSAGLRKSILGGRVAIRLIRIAGDWARAQKAEELHVHSTSALAPEQTDGLLRRLGFETFGGNYVTRLVAPQTYSSQP